MVKGVDYSFSRPSPAEIKQAGYEFVARYVPYAGVAKGLSMDELASLRIQGLKVVMVFESTSGRALQGRVAGQEDARTALAGVGSLGIKDRPIYFAVDFDASEADQGSIDEYLHGCGDVLGKGRVGVYGSYYVVSRCSTNGSAAWFWQTYAWSGGKRFRGSHMLQYLNGQSLGGGSVDLNEAYPVDYGQYPLPMQEDDITQAQADQQSLQDGYIQEVGNWPDSAYIEDWKSSGLSPYAYNQQHIQKDIHAQVYAGGREEGAADALNTVKPQIDDLNTKLKDAEGRANTLGQACQDLQGQIDAMQKPTVGQAIQLLLGALFPKGGK